MFNETLSEDLITLFLINFQEIIKTRLFAAKRRHCYIEMNLWRQRNEEVLALGISLGKRSNPDVCTNVFKSVTRLSTVVICSRKRNDRKGTATIDHTHTHKVFYMVLLPFLSTNNQEQIMSPGTMLYARYKAHLIPVCTELAV